MSSLDRIIMNNLFNNSVNASFDSYRINCLLPNLWFRNYLGDWSGIGRYTTNGFLVIINCIDSDSDVNWTHYKWKNYDYLPAQEPFDIP